MQDAGEVGPLCLGTKAIRQGGCLQINILLNICPEFMWKAGGGGGLLWIQGPTPHRTLAEAEGTESYRQSDFPELQ